MTEKKKVYGRIPTNKCRRIKVKRLSNTTVKFISGKIRYYAQDSSKKNDEIGYLGNLKIIFPKLLTNYKGKTLL